MARRRHNSAQPADAMAMLKDDHQKVRGLFQAYEAARDPRAKRACAEEACMELAIHAQLEERVLYPAVADQAGKAGEKLAQASLEDHETVKDLMQALQDLRLDDKAFDAKFHKLIHNVEDHMAAEESEMFPLVEAALSEDMDALMAEMQELQEQIRA